VLGETIAEIDETLHLSLTNFSHDGLAGTTRPIATFTIVDDDFSQSDFGDAPVPYPTTLLEDGPRHVGTGPTLGATRDIENDGTHSAGAGADEDGVTFGAIAAGVLDASVTVNVQGAVGKLDAWIDFNGDGSWGGPGEQIFDSQAVSTGDSTLMFDVPSWAVAGITFARFRLSTVGGLGPRGFAADGEVEDYQVTISPPSAASGVFGGQRTISTDADGATSVFAADVDGDGDMDVLSASARDNKIAWYENDSNQIFTARTIGTNADGVNSVFAVDVDGDGDVDALSASGYGKIAWYENDGDESFTAHTISTDADSAGSVFAADVDGDGDGDVDVLSASSGDDKIAWYEDDGNEDFTAHTISTDADGASSVFATDMDGDGDIDVLSASGYDDKIAWYENRPLAYNFDGPQFSADEGDVTNTTNVIMLTRSGSTSVSTSVDVVLTSDTATAGVDFTAGPVTMNFGIGETTKAVPLEVLGDTMPEGNEAIHLSLTNFSHDGLAGTTHPVSVYTIVDDDLHQGEYGDAPVPYPTTLFADGARHVGTGPTLGTTRDTETDGTHSASAGADGADEDGVTFGTISVGALGASVTVNVQAAVGKLDAWIDFNGNGSWGGPSEQVFDSEAVSTGDNILMFDVPSWAAAGVTFARFRLSTAGDLGPGGFAVDGEVEDYQVTIRPPSAASGVFGGQRTISTDADAAQSVFAADLDGDGDMDVLSASVSDDKIAWYENDGSESFTAHTVSTDADGAQSVFAADVDGDGDVDVLSASFNDDKIAWYENDGDESVAPHIISTDADRARSVFAADVDGDMDVLSASSYDDKIAWYENDGSESFTARIISIDADNALSVFAADVDGDGDMDVLSASYYGDAHVMWYENDGSENFTGHTISTDVNRYSGARSVFAADVDGDGDMDVLSASSLSLRIAWYENDGGENFTARRIGNNSNEGLSVFPADMDGDGDFDVLSGTFLSDDNVQWHENDGRENFTDHTLVGVPPQANVIAADLDGDGDLDVLSASRNLVHWYENVGEPAVWDGDNAAIGNVGDGLTWNDANNWTVKSIVDVLPDAGPPGNIITFRSAPTVSAISLGGDRSANSLVFEDSYRLSGHTLSVTSGSISVAAGVEVSIDSTLVSAAGTVKRGAGRLHIMGDAPDVIVTEGTLVVASTATLQGLTVASGATVVFNGSVGASIIGDVVNDGTLIIGIIDGDLNGNGVLEAGDIDLMFVQLAAGEANYDARFDLVPDGVIDDKDARDLVLNRIGTLFGDANLDWVVDGNDFNVWNANRFRSATGWARGDFNGDGVTDARDLNLWNASKFDASLPVAVTGSLTNPRTPRATGRAESTVRRGTSEAQQVVGVVIDEDAMWSKSFQPRKSGSRGGERITLSSLASEKESSHHAAMRPRIVDRVFSLIEDIDPIGRSSEAENGQVRWELLPKTNHPGHKDTKLG